MVRQTGFDLEAPQLDLRRGALERLSKVSRGFEDELQSLDNRMERGFNGAFNPWCETVLIGGVGIYRCYIIREGEQTQAWKLRRTWTRASSPQKTRRRGWERSVHDMKSVLKPE